MLIEKQVRAIEKLFAQTDKATTNFINKSGINCPQGCAKCCHGQKVSATPLEFLPYAYHLYELGLLEDSYWELKINTKVSCVLVEGENETSYGWCTKYPYRGMICRLFGNAAMTNKEGKKLLSACAIIKNQIVEKPNFNEILQQSAPVVSDFYMKLRSIDTEYGSMMIPVNLAILKSMEIVYYNTRRKRKKSV
jgi:uncharacterized protein